MAHHVTRPQHRRGALVRRVAGGLTIAAVAVLGAAPVQASSGGRRIKDADSNRTVFLVCLALVLLAAALAVFTWWFWRNTRRNPEALGPLEVMGERQFVDGDVTARQTLLDANRPVGAVPLVAGVPEPLMVESDPGVEVAAGSSAAGSSDDPASVASSDGEPDPDIGEQTKLLEIPAEPVEETPTPAAAPSAAPGSLIDPGLIDPGLPREEPAEADGEQLTLAELASMDLGFRAFDPDELTSTPSTGIPVIESPEAWVEREVSAARSNGTAEVAVTLPPVVDPPSEVAAAAPATESAAVAEQE